MTTFSGITGTDGHSPIYDPDARWTTWSLAEIYMGTAGMNRYVPKIKDYVIDLDTNQVYYVYALDPSSFIPTLVEVRDVPTAEFTDVLLGVGPGTQSDTYRIYIDKSVLPYTLAVDARLSVAGTMCKTAKIFRGSLLAGAAEVISAFYDGSGNLLGNAIPLELVASPDNVSIKTVPVCYTTYDLADGELVTAVFYSDDGHVVSKRQLLVENTGFIRSANTGVKYVSSISLETPFLSSSNPNLIRYPLNVPLEGMNLIGVVNYSDGSALRLPVDGTKFSIFGFQNFVSTVVGQTFPLVLKYQLSDGEVCYGLQVGVDNFVSESYQATTIAMDGAYTVKLFGWPTWIDSVNGYRMDWYLYNLDRDVIYHATPYVSFNPNTPAFNPTAYGVNQHLSVSLNLQNLNGAYKSYIHTQALDVVLAGPGTQRTTNWTIGYEPNQTPPYGLHLFAKSWFTNSNVSQLQIDSGFATQADWLAGLYRAAKPLTDPTVELAAPEPTHFAIITGGVDAELPIAQWNSLIALDMAFPDSGTVVVKFFKRTADNDIQLGQAALPVYQQN